MTAQRAWTADGPGRPDPTGSGGSGCNEPSTDIEQSRQHVWHHRARLHAEWSNQVRRMAVHVREDKLHAKKAFCRACGEQPAKTQKQHGAGGNGKDGGASPRQAPPKSPTPSANGESTKTTNNDTRRKITLLEEAKTARELGDEDMLQAIENKTARRKGRTRRCTTNRSPTGQCNRDSGQENAELEKQREQMERALEKLNRLQAEAMEADKKVTNVEGSSTHGRARAHKKDRNFPRATTSRKLPRDWQP